MCRGGRRCPPVQDFSFFCPFPFCLRRVTFFPWRKKVTKERHLRGEGFRFPSPLKKPLTLKRPKGRAAALPFGNLTPGVSGDYQIAPLPRSGKGRWRPLAADDMKRKRIPTGASRPRNDREKTGRTLGRRSVGRTALPARNMMRKRRGDVGIAPYETATEKPCVGADGLTPPRYAPI